MSSLSGSRSRSSSGSTTRTPSVCSVKSEYCVPMTDTVLSSESLTGEKTSNTVSEVDYDTPWKESDFCYDFMDPQIDHDRILLVGGKDLHGISNILMESSDFFKILFGENFKESGQEKIELKDVETEDFIEFLNHLYCNNKNITKDNFLTLHMLADRFLTPLLLKKCLNFIKKNLDMINEFGQRALDLLQTAIDMDLKDIKNAFKRKLFTPSCILCKICKQETIIKKKRDFGLYLAPDHFCMKHRDYIMSLHPKSISFILESLIESVNKNKFDSYDGSTSSIEEDSDGEGDYSNKKLLIYDFVKKGPYHDSTILIKDLVKDTEQIFNVDSKIVCSGAKWFRGRLEKGSQLVLTDVSAAHFEIFLNFIYPNAHKFFLETSLILLEMSTRFESPFLYQKAFDELKQEITTEAVTHCESEAICLLDMAMKYNLREVKKFYYKACIQPYWKDIDAIEPCKATKDFKKHQFKPEGIRNWLDNTIFYDHAIRKLSPESRRFILSCLLKNVHL